MIEKLKWITWSIMPLVYDESLSYVELLDKVIAKLNEVIEATNNFTKPVQETIDTWLKSDEGQAAVEQSVGEFIVAYSKTPSFQQVLVSALENQSAEVKAAASKAAEAYLNSPDGKTALDTEIRDYMLVYTKTDEFKNLISEYVMELNDILRGEKLDIRQKNSTAIQTPKTVISSTEIANDYSAGSAKSRVEVNSNGVHIYSDEDMSNPAISASGGVVALGKNLDAKTHRIMNLPTPEATHEAANKFYVDQAIAKIPGGGGGGGGGAGVITVNVSRNSQGIWTASKTYEQIAVNLNAGNIVKAVIRDGRAPNALTCSTYTSAEVKFTGVVAVAQQEVAITGRHKPSRYYITTVTIANNNQVSVDETEWNNYSFIQTDGSTSFTNAQSMGNNQLRDLAAPTKDTDAATKGYVDSHGGGGGGSGGGGVSLGEIRLTDLDNAAENVQADYYIDNDSYVFSLIGDEDNTQNYTGGNAEVQQQIIEACSAFAEMDLGNKPVNATITFYIKFPGDANATRLAISVNQYVWQPAGDGTVDLAMVLAGRSAYPGILKVSPTDPPTIQDISFSITKLLNKGTGKFQYSLIVWYSNPKTQLISSCAAALVNNVHRDDITGAFTTTSAGVKIDKSYAPNGDIPSVLLIPTSYNEQINQDLVTYSSVFIANGVCTQARYDNSDRTSRKYVYEASYLALNNSNVTFHTKFTGQGDMLELPIEMKTTASGVPDVIDGTITVGDDGTISAVTLNGLNKTLLSGIWSWKDKWDCSSELSLTYLTVGENNFKYTFKLARAYKVNPNDATNTMYGLDFECDKGDYKMVITQTFDTASETVPAATYKTVKYGGGNDSGGGGGTTDSAMWEQVANDTALVGMFNKSTTINLSKPCREIALYSDGFTTETSTTKPSLTIKTNNNKEYKFELATGTNVKIVATAKNDQGVLTASVVKTNNATDTFLYTNADANALFNSIIVDYTGVLNSGYTGAKLKIKGR